MKSGVCPKCGSNEVYSRRGSYWTSPYMTISVDYFSHVKTDIYVCANCGFTEVYIPDVNALRKIAKKWQSVDSRKRKRDET
jgi:predicted nucleic-acid-binding Zn-ribbon protein